MEHPRAVTCPPGIIINCIQDTNVVIYNVIKDTLCSALTHVVFCITRSEPVDHLAQLGLSAQRSGEAGEGSGC